MTGTEHPTPRPPGSPAGAHGGGSPRTSDAAADRLEGAGARNVDAPGTAIGRRDADVSDADSPESDQGGRGTSAPEAGRSAVGGPVGAGPGDPDVIDDAVTDRAPTNAAPSVPGARVAEVEDLPLSERAEAYRALHEELAQRLEQAPGDA